MNKAFVRYIVLAAVATLWVINKIRVSMSKAAPVGYEDEAGFHFGVPSFYK